MEPGMVVRAVYDFATEEAGELTLQIGDIIQVLKKVDKQWSYGLSNGREGNFPSGFAIELKVPSLHNGQELYAALGDFVAQELGDLSFKKGDIIVGTEAIDSNWWKGKCNGQSGIFPLTHVWKVDRKTVIMATSPKKLCLKAKVRTTMKAQLKAEMDLFKDEIVLITEEVDKGWYRGECNGRSGIFPAGFVTLLSDEEIIVNSESALYGNFQNVSTGEANAVLPNVNVMQDSSNDQYGYDCLNSGITAYGRTIYPFRSEYPNELNFEVGEIVNLIRYVDEKWMEGEMDGKVGIFPKDFIDIIVDCPAPSPRIAEINSVVPVTEPDVFIFPLDTYGRVLYDFHPQLEGDVCLKEGDTVTLLREIDKNWYEVSTDNGNVGICPSNFIEVIGSAPETLPPSYADVMKVIDYDNQMISNKNFEVGDFSFESVFHHSTNNNHLPYQPTVNNQIFIQNKSLGNKDVYPVSNSKGIEHKISENLINLNRSEPASNSHSAVHDLSPHPSEFDNKASAFQTSTFPTLARFQINDLSSSSNGLQDSSVSWSTADFISSNNVDNPTVDETSLLRNNEALAKVPKATPVRPPPPTIIWPSQREKVTSSSPVPKPPEAAVRNSLRRQSSLANSEIEQNDLHQQISAKEEQIKTLESCKAKLEEEVGGSDKQDFVSIEIREQINQFGDEINSIRKEVQSLRGNLQKQNLSSPSSEMNNKNGEADREEEVQRKRKIEEKRREVERLKKMKEQRQCVITEILQTERDYIGDMKILQATFLQNPEEARSKGVDVSTLFGNLEEVIDIAARLLQRLQKTASAGGENQMIGECFTDMADDMKEVYGHYCRNHDDVNTILDKYDETSPGWKYLKHKFELMKRQTNCFDLPSMLIKPVQRILKYPLLLNELVKCTEDGHPDKQYLISAVALMTDVATAINEFKRRKDLVFKYRKHADTSLSGRISKLNLHSMLKKSSRFGMRLSNTIGLTSVMKDEAFEKLLKKFNAVEKTSNIFLKDICMYAEKVEELVTTAFNMAEDIAEVYQERKTQLEVDQFRSTHKRILTEFFQAFKCTTKVSVIEPLQQLLKMYHGPNNLIRKREDKLLDYESCANKLEKNRDVTKIKMLQDNQLMAKNTYEALNSQLLDDLPKLCSISTDILRDCILSFLKARKNFVGKMARQMLGLMELPLMLGFQGSILETFQVKHNLVVDNLCQLSIVPKNLFPSSKTSSLKKSASPRNNRMSVDGTSQLMMSQTLQNPSQKAYVLSSHPQSELYSAWQNYDAVDLLDISLRKGDVVGVIKYQDPMGSKLRWFVDNGVSKGFVSGKVLVKYISDPSVDQDVSQNAERSVNNRMSLPVQVSFDSTRNEVARRSLRAGSAYPPPAYSAVQKPVTQSLGRNAKVCGILQPTRPAPSVQEGRNSSIQKTTVPSNSFPIVSENNANFVRNESLSNGIPLATLSGQLNRTSYTTPHDPSEQSNMAPLTTSPGQLNRTPVTTSSGSLSRTFITTPSGQLSRTLVTAPSVQLNRTPLTTVSEHLNKPTIATTSEQFNETSVASPSGQLNRTSVTEPARALNRSSKTTPGQLNRSSLTTPLELPGQLNRLSLNMSHRQSIDTSVTGSCGKLKQVGNEHFPAPVDTVSRYEEIDDLDYGENRYNVIANDVSLIGENVESDVTRNRYSSVLYNEFDPCAPKDSAQEFYEQIPDYSATTDLYTSHRYEDIPGDNADTPIESNCLEYHFALYDFKPMGQNQLNLTKGQVVLVLHKCDLNKNGDWWFVEDRHQNKGYVPSSYLMRYSEQVA